MKTGVLNLQGCKENIITKDFYWPSYEDDNPYNEKNLVWISLDDPKQQLIHRDYDYFGEIITINGIPGKLTEHGTWNMEHGTWNMEHEHGT